MNNGDKMRTRTPFKYKELCEKEIRRWLDCEYEEENK